MSTTARELNKKLKHFFASETLPGQKYQDEMMPEARRQLDFNHQAPAKKSAVLILLYKANDKWHLILTKRNEYDGSHSGQICFPGGKKEETDSDLLATALRETEEEIGYKCASEFVVGQLSSVYIHVSNYCVEPYIAVINDKPDLTLDALEVKHIIDLPLENIVLDKYRSTKTLTIKEMTFSTPVFLTDNDYIWGATAMMLAEFSEILKRIDVKHIL